MARRKMTKRMTDSSNNSEAKKSKTEIPTEIESSSTSKSEESSSTTKTEEEAKPQASSDSDTAGDYGSEATNSAGKKWNLKITSWNMNGIRACLGKGCLEFIKQEDPDILCIQETKCSNSKLPKELKSLEGYESMWSSADKEGYSGVGILSKTKPISVKNGLGIKEHDQEGRLITAEYPDFYLVNTYVPNSGRKLIRLGYRQEWNKALLEHLQELDKKKPVILCGDLNVSHLEIDLANPKTNTKNAGFTKEERNDFSELLKAGFIDSFRELYPEKTGAYTFWTYMMNSRAKNVGWRLDYFVLSERFRENLCDNLIRSRVMGSDHCPITALLVV